MLSFERRLQRTHESDKQRRRGSTRRQFHASVAAKVLHRADGGRAFFGGLAARPSARQRQGFWRSRRAEEGPFGRESGSNPGQAR